jgi:hypothetical protein
MENQNKQTEMELNYERIKESEAYMRMANKQIVRAIIKTCPKEVLIDVLKAEGIIERDWSKDKRVLKEKI